MEKLLRVEEAAALLGTTKGQLRQRIFKKQVPARKLGGSVVFVQSELEDFMRSLPKVWEDEKQQNATPRKDTSQKRSKKGDKIRNKK